MRPTLRLTLPAIVFFLGCAATSSAAAPAGIPALAAATPSSNGVTIELALGSYAVVPDASAAAHGLGAPGARAVRIEASGLTSSIEPGLPELPTKGLFVALPPGASPRLVIEEASFRRESSVWIAPPPTSRVGDEGIDDDPSATPRFAAIPDAERYATDAFFPDAPARLTLRGIVRDLDFVKIELDPFLWNPVTRELRIYERLRVRVEYGSDGPTPVPAHDGGSAGARQRHETARAQAPIAAPASRGRLDDDMFVNGPVPDSWRVRRAADALAAATASMNPAANGEAYKIAVQADALYRVTYEALVVGGMAAGPVPYADLKLELRGVLVPFEAVDADGDGALGPGDAVEFFGVANPERWTKTHVYWLTRTGGGARMTRRPALPADSARWPQAASAKETVHVERDEALFTLTTYEPDVWDPWVYTYKIRSGPTSGNCFTLNTPTLDVDVPLMDKAAPDPTRTYHLRGQVLGRKVGVCNPDSQQVDLSLNGTGVGSVAWSVAATGTLQSFSLPIDPATLMEGTNRVRIDQPVLANTLRWSHLDYLELEYEKKLIARNGLLEFRGTYPQGAVFYLRGFAATDVEIIDVRGDGTVDRVIGPRAVSTGPGSPMSLSFAVPPSPVSHRFWITKRSLVPALPAQRDQPSNLRDPATRAEYVAIAHASFLAATAPIVDLHRAEGMSGQVFDVQDVYDEFSWGNIDARAIRDFLAYSISAGTWAAPPTYVLLVGDSTTDFQNRLGLPSSPFFLPHEESIYLGGPNHLPGLQMGDVGYVLLVGSDPVPDLLVGRLAAQSASEVERYHRKLVRYAAAPAGAWTERTLLVVDDTIDGNDDPVSCPTTRNSVELFAWDEAGCYLSNGTTNPNLLRIIESEWGCSPGNDGRQVIIDERNAGVSLFLYVGHGAIQELGRKCGCGTPLPVLLGYQDLPRLTNQDMLPLTSTVSCNVAAFGWTDVFQGSRCMGEWFTLLSDAGDLGFIGNTTSITELAGRGQQESIYDSLFVPEAQGSSYLPTFLPRAVARRKMGAVHFAAQLGFIRNARTFDPDEGMLAARTLVLHGDPGATLRIGEPPTPPGNPCF